MRRDLRRTLTIAGVLLTTAACPRTTAEPGVAPEQTTATVHVDNRSFNDMRIYAMRSTQRIRLGTVTGNTRQDFRIPSHLVGIAAQLQIVADPIGGRRARVSETFIVNPGDRITMVISPP